MINTDNLCLSCMKEIGEIEKCPFCGALADEPQMSPYLPKRAVIGNRYLIGKMLENNGDGATYIGWDISSRSVVTVREFFPDAIAYRNPNEKDVSVMAGCESTFNDCYHSFLELWRKLARLRGLSSLISVLDIVEEFNTVYAVCEYIESTTLRDFLLKSRTGYISWEKARQLFMPVLSTIGTLHSAGIIHRGISPTTLLISGDGKVWITGFSIGQARTARGDLTPQLFPGYAAIEQYGFEGRQGPWTDIYAFAAVLYRSLIGSDPIEATIRATNDRLMVPGKFAEQIPAYVINGLVNALQILPEDRTRSVEHLRAEISASPSAAVAGEEYVNRKAASSPVPAPKDETDDDEDKPFFVKDEKTTLAIKVGGITLIAGLVIALILVFTVFREQIGLSPFGAGASNTSASIPTSVESIIVPDFVGNQQSYTEILDNPVWKAFDFEPVYQFSRKVAKGYIISQSIEANKVVPEGTKITLTVSKGIETVVMPDVTGKTYIDAYTELAGLGFVVERIDKEITGSQMPEVVSEMSREPKKEYEKGEKVVLQVWTAVEETTVEPSSEESDDVFDPFYQN